MREGAGCRYSSVLDESSVGGLNCYSRICRVRTFRDISLRERSPTNMTFLIQRNAAILTASCSSDCALLALSSSSSAVRVARLQISRIDVMSCLITFRKPVMYGINFSV